VGVEVVAEHVPFTQATERERAGVGGVTVEAVAAEALAGDEEGRPRAVPHEDVEERRGGGSGAVVEGEGDRALVGHEGIAARGPGAGPHEG
jgi:hypothetical protein